MTAVRALPPERVLEFANSLPGGQRERVIDLAGKWKHGWIPLDAIAAAIKAKQMKGDGIRRPGANVGAVRPSGKSRLDPKGAASHAAIVSGARAKGRPPARRTPTSGPGAVPRNHEERRAAAANTRADSHQGREQVYNREAAEATRASSAARAGTGSHDDAADAHHAAASAAEHAGQADRAAEHRSIAEQHAALHERAAAPAAAPSSAPSSDIRAKAAEAVRLKAPELKARAAQGDKVAAAELERRASNRAAKQGAGTAESTLEGRYSAARTPAEKHAAASALADHYAAKGKTTQAKNWRRAAAKHSPDADVSPDRAHTPEKGAAAAAALQAAHDAKQPHTAAVAGVGDGAAVPDGMPTISREDAMRRLAASYTHAELAAELKRAKTGSDAHKVLHEEGVRRLQQAEHPDAPPRTETPTPMHAAEPAAAEATPAAKVKAKRKPSAVIQDWRRERDAQMTRYENHLRIGNNMSQDEYFGEGDMEGKGTAVEQRLRYSDFLEQRRQGKEHERRGQAAYDAGAKLGQVHGQQDDSSAHEDEYRHHEAGHDPETFASGYSDGIMAGAAAHEAAQTKAKGDAFQQARDKAGAASIRADRANTADAHREAILAHAAAGQAALDAGNRDAARHHVDLAQQHKGKFEAAKTREAEAGDATKVNARLRAESAARGEPQTEAEHAARAHDWNIGNRVQATADGHSTLATPADAAAVLRSRWTSPAQKAAARKIAQQRHEALTATTRERLSGKSDAELAKMLHDSPLSSSGMPAEHKRAVAAVARERLAARGSDKFTTADRTELNRKLESNPPTTTHVGQSMSDGDLARANPRDLTDRDLLIERESTAMIPARHKAIQDEINRRQAEKNAARPPAEPKVMPDAEARAIARMGSEKDRSRAPGPKGEQHGDVVTLTGVGSSGERRAVYVGRDVNGNPLYRGAVNGTMTTSSVPASSYDKIGPRVNKGSEIVPRNPGQSRFTPPDTAGKRVIGSMSNHGEIVTVERTNGRHRVKVDGRIHSSHDDHAQAVTEAHSLVPEHRRANTEDGARKLHRDIEAQAEADRKARVAARQQQPPPPPGTVRLERNQSIVIGGPNAGQVREGSSSATAGTSASRGAFPIGQRVENEYGKGTVTEATDRSTTVKLDNGESLNIQRGTPGHGRIKPLEEPASDARRFGQAANSGQRANIGEAQAQARRAAQGPPQQGEMFGGHGEHQGDMFDQPPAESSPKIRVEHSGDGTVVYGTERGDTATTEALKAQGFKWSRNLEGWYLPRTWSQSTRELRVRGLEQRLGDKITVERGSAGKTTTAAERHAAEVARAEANAEKHASRSGKASSEAERRFNAADAATAGIPFGQPILVGHHSQRRHERALEKSHNNMRAGVDAHARAQEEERLAASSAARARQLGDPRAAARRLERNQAELRKVDRSIAGTDKAKYPQHHERLLAMRAELADKVAHDSAIAEPVLGKYGKHNVQPGDVVTIRGSASMVHSVGPKNVKVHTSVGPLPYPLTQIQGHGKLEDASTATLQKLLANPHERRRLPQPIIDRIESILRARGEA